MATLPEGSLQSPQGPFPHSSSSPSSSPSRVVLARVPPQRAWSHDHSEGPKQGIEALPSRLHMLPPHLPLPSGHMNQTHDPFPRPLSSRWPSNRASFMVSATSSTCSGRLRFAPHVPAEGDSSCHPAGQGSCSFPQTEDPFSWCLPAQMPGRHNNQQGVRENRNRLCTLTIS